jgi:hypothetical protein
VNGGGDGNAAGGGVQVDARSVEQAVVRDLQLALAQTIQQHRDAATRLARDELAEVLPGWLAVLRPALAYASAEKGWATGRTHRRVKTRMMTLMQHQFEKSMADLDLQPLPPSPQAPPPPPPGQQQPPAEEALLPPPPPPPPVGKGLVAAVRQQLPGWVERLSDIQTQLIAGQGSPDIAATISGLQSMLRTALEAGMAPNAPKPAAAAAEGEGEGAVVGEVPPVAQPQQMEMEGGAAAAGAVEQEQREGAGIEVNDAELEGEDPGVGVEGGAAAAAQQQQQQQPAVQLVAGPLHAPPAEHNTGDTIGVDFPKEDVTMPAAADGFEIVERMSVRMWCDA